ncbi:hypothetical protein B566_EDAN010653 [Ephemera danica]|nr:hypothetical protein B566_EDAN010653 [Ephemera danica]
MAQLSCGLVLLVVCLKCVFADEEPAYVPNENFTVVYEWFKLDYAWQDDSSKAAALSAGRYIPEHNAPAGLSVFGSRVFVSVPRWLPGVPVTLAWLPSAGATTASPKLHPFPSWEMQQAGNCSALQSVMSMEVDSIGRLWVVDAGRLNFRRAERPDYSRCPPKLVVFNLNDNNRIEFSFDFPDSVASKNKSLLSDLVIDVSPGRQSDQDWFAYISDAGTGAIIVFSLSEKRAWRLADPSMGSTKPEHEPPTLGLDLGISGIALAPLREKSKTLYFSTLSSTELFSLPTSELRDSATSKLSVKLVAKRSAPARGLAMDSTGVMYFGLLGKHTVASWDTKKHFSESVAFTDQERLQWPDSFAFDMSDNLWFVTSRLQNMLNRRLNLNEPNFRLIQANVGAKSYMYSDWTTDQPDTDGASSTLGMVTLVTSSLLLALLH